MEPVTVSILCCGCGAKELVDPGRAKQWVSDHAGHGGSVNERFIYEGEQMRLWAAA